PRARLGSFSFNPLHTTTLIFAHLAPFVPLSCHTQRNRYGGSPLCDSALWLSSMPSFCWPSLSPLGPNRCPHRFTPCFLVLPSRTPCLVRLPPWPKAN